MFGFVYVRLYGVDVPYSDTWNMVPVFEKLSSGTLTLADLFAQQNEHRIFLPRVVLLLLGVATAFDTVVPLYLIQCCLLLTLVALFLAFRDSVSANPLFFVPVPFLVFGLGQYWNMVQAFQIALVFAQTFSVLALYLLYVSRREGLRRFSFPGALASATAGSLSAAPGLLAWPVGFLLLLMLPVERPVKRFLAGAWGLVGLMETVVYFLDYSSPADHTTSRYLFGEPLKLLKVFLTMLGGSLFRERELAFAAGLLLVFLVAAALLLVYFSGKPGECSFWVALLIFASLILASTTLARGGSGIGNALNSKYVTYSTLVVISTYAMLVRSAFGLNKLAVVSLGVLSVLIAWGVPVSYDWGIEKGRETEARREKAAFVLATYESQPDEALGILKRHFRTSPETARERASTLEALGYSVFSEKRPRVLPPSLSSLSPARSHTPHEVETISGVEVDPEDQPTVVPKDKPLKVAGWAVDGGAGDVAGGVYVVIDGKPFPAFYGTKKEAVAERFDNPAYEHSGFERAIPISEIGPGKHRLSVIIVTNDQRRHYMPDRAVVFEVE
jgi:hypothetical protein